MSKSKAQLQSEANKLRDEIARNEAILGNQREKLAKIEALLTGDPAPISGHEQLWKAALPMARTRSSKHLCKTEWNRIPKHERPDLETALKALRAWNACEEWKKDGNSYVPGLHRWIKSRQWENLPETKAERDALARYRTVPKPVQPPSPDDAVTDRQSIADLLSLAPKRMNS